MRFTAPTSMDRQRHTSRGIQAAYVRKSGRYRQKSMQKNPHELNYDGLYCHGLTQDDCKKIIAISRVEKFDTYYMNSPLLW